MSVEFVEELRRRCRERVGLVRPRDLSAVEDAAVEVVYREVVAAYAELRVALESLSTTPTTPAEVRTRAELAIDDERTALMLDLFETGYLVGARMGLRVGILEAQAPGVDHAAHLLKALRDDDVADRMFAERAAACIVTA